MGSPQSEDINREIVHAWRDAEYARSLPLETVKAMPPPPEDISSMTDDDLMQVLRSGAGQELNEDQLAMAAGAGSNGQNYDYQVDQAQAKGSSLEQADVIARMAVTPSYANVLYGISTPGPAN